MKKGLNRYLNKKDIWISNKPMKECLTSLVLGKHKLVTLGNIKIHLVDWLKFKRWIIPSVVKNVEELELSYTASRNVK